MAVQGFTPVRTNGMGMLCITDARMIVRPVRSKWLPYDDMFAATLLDLGNDQTAGQDAYHIISGLTFQETQRLLHLVFRTYVETCSVQRPCQAQVDYFANGDRVRVEHYDAFCAPEYTLRFNVYCNVADVEVLIAELCEAVTPDHPLIVVRPSGELDFTLEGFAAVVNDSDESDEDDIELLDDEECPDCGRVICVCDDEDTEDPLKGDVDTGFGYEEPPNPLNTQHYHALENLGGYL